MLPNHAPLVIAEQFGTLESLTRAASTSASAARRAPTSERCARCAATRSSADTFPQDVLELQALLRRARSGPGCAGRSRARALKVPLWILGSSLFGAQLAATLGLPFAFASTSRRPTLLPALAIYRENFRPSAQLDGRTRWSA